MCHDFCLLLLGSVAKSNESQEGPNICQFSVSCFQNWFQIFMTSFSEFSLISLSFNYRF